MFKSRRPFIGVFISTGLWPGTNQLIPLVPNGLICICEGVLFFFFEGGGFSGP